MKNITKINRPVRKETFVRQIKSILHIKQIPNNLYNYLESYNGLTYPDKELSIQWFEQVHNETKSFKALDKFYRDLYDTFYEGELGELVAWEKDIYELTERLEELYSLYKKYEEDPENSPFYNEWQEYLKYEKDFDIGRITLFKLYSLSKYYISWKTEKEKEINKAKENKQNIKTINKIEEVLTEDIEIDIEELKDNELHQYLKENPLYKTFYMLWRIRFKGMYDSIPLFFIFWISNLLRYTEKIKIKTYNDSKIEKLNLLTFAASGKYKSSRGNFLFELGEKVAGVIGGDLGAPTKASIRGTVELKQKHNIDYFVAYPGAAARYLIMFDELKPLLKKIAREESLDKILLDIPEKYLIPAETAIANQPYRIIQEFNMIYEKYKQKGDKKQLEKLELLKEYMKEETDFYIIKKEKFKVNNIFMFKTNCGVLIFSQPIFNNSAVSEKKMQISFGLNSGFFYRFLFHWDIEEITAEEDDRYEKERLEYIEKMRILYNIKKEKDISYLENRIIEEFRKVFEKLKEIEYTNYYEISVMKKVRSELSDQLKNIYNKKSIDELESYFKSYMNRIEVKARPILLTLAYLKGRDGVIDEDIDVVVKFLAKKTEDFWNYLNEIYQEERNYKVIDETIYIKIIIEEIYNYFIENNINLIDITDWPKESYIQEKVKSNIILNYKKFRFKLYERAINKMINSKICYISSVNPNTGKKFDKRQKKIILKKIIDENKTDYIKKIEEVKQLINKKW